MRVRKIRMPLWGMRIIMLGDYYCLLMSVIGLFTSHVTNLGAVTPPVTTKKEHIGKKSVSKMLSLLCASSAQAEYTTFGGMG